MLPPFTSVPVLARVAPAPNTLPALVIIQAAGAVSAYSPASRKPVPVIVVGLSSGVPGAPPVRVTIEP